MKEAWTAHRRETIRLILAGLGIPIFLPRALRFAGSPARASDAQAFDALPFDRSKAANPGRKVFAHWHFYPISVDNLPADRDFYARESLNPKYPNGSYRDFGSAQRERPLPRPPRSGPDWALEDMLQDIRWADAIGIDAFLFNIVSVDTDSWFWGNFTSMLSAAERLGGDFRVIPNLDIAILKDQPTSKIVAALKTVGASPGLMRQPSGPIVLGAFLAERWPAGKWRSLFDELTQAGISIAFLPTFLNMREASPEQLKLGPIVSEWSGDRRQAIPGAAYVNEYVRKNGAQWCAPVWPQDFRPKDGVYTEAHNSDLFRSGWMSAIVNEADHVQIVTWNDYSESSEIRPSTAIQYSFYDLAAYYIAWFKSGSPPKIVRDVLYYFHRVQLSHASAIGASQKTPFKLLWDHEPDDKIELLAFLTSPGRLEIEINGQVSRLDAQTGITSMTAPLAAGRPSFRLKRGDATIIDVASAFEISDRSEFQNLLYHGGSSTRQPPVTEPELSNKPLAGMP